MVDGVKRSVAIEEQGDLVCHKRVDISHQRDGHVMRVSLDSHAVEVSPDDLGTADLACFKKKLSYETVTEFNCTK